MMQPSPPHFKTFPLGLLALLLLILTTSIVVNGRDGAANQKNDDDDDSSSVTDPTMAPQPEPKTAIRMTPPTLDPNNPSQLLFHVCSVGEDDDVVDVMPHVEAGANVEWQDPNWPQPGMTCLMRAVMEGKYTVVSVMLEQGAHMNTTHYSALHLAAEHGRLAIFKDLLLPELLRRRKDGVDDEQDSSSSSSSMQSLLTTSYHQNGWLPIHYACYPGHQKRMVDMVLYMVQELGVPLDVPAHDEHKFTCRDLAIPGTPMSRALDELTMTPTNNGNIDEGQARNQENTMHLHSKL